MRRFISGFAALGFLAAVSAAPPARAQPPLTVDVTQVIAAAYPDVVAVVSVQDATGAPVAGLATSNFAATDGDSPVPVVGAQAAVNADVGLAVVLVMDTSGSMEGEPLALTEEAAVRFVDSLLPKDGAVVISFADGVSPPSPLTADKPALAATLRGLQAVGSTALYDAVVAGAQAAKAAPLPRKVVVLLTDGQESGNRSAATMEQSLAEAAAAGVPFFAIGVGEDINVSYLQDLATRSGGQFLAAPAPGDIPAVYDRIGIMLRSQYLVHVTLSAPADGGTSDLKLTVTAGGASASGSARVARPGVPSTATPTSTPSPTPEAATTAAGGGGGGPNPMIFVLAGAVGVLLVGGGFVGVKRARRRRPSPDVGPAEAARSYEPPPVAALDGARRAVRPPDGRRRAGQEEEPPPGRKRGHVGRGRRLHAAAGQPGWSRRRASRADLAARGPLHAPPPGGRRLRDARRRQGAAVGCAGGRRRDRHRPAPAAVRGRTIPAITLIQHVEEGFSLPGIPLP